MPRRLVFVTLENCGLCDEVKEQLDPSIEVLDLNTLTGKPGIEKVCPSPDQCKMPQFALMDGDKIIEAFPEERWGELENAEQLAKLLEG